MLRVSRLAFQLTLKDIVEQYAYTDDAGDEDGFTLSTNVAKLASESQLAVAFTNFYDPFAYDYCSFDAPTIEQEAERLGASEGHRLCILSPYVAVRRPAHLPALLGPSRYDSLARVLGSLRAARDAGPLSLAGSLPFHSALFPLLRGLCLCAAVRHPLASQAGHVLTALAAGEHLGGGLRVEGDFQERGSALARLLLATAREFGSVPLLLTALSLRAQNGVAVDYAAARQVTYIVWAAERRRLDWALKTKQHAL